MAIAKHISLNGTVIDIGGCTEVWNIVESSGTYSITGHSTPYADITSVLNKNGAVILKDSLNRYFYMAGNFGSGSEERYSFTYNEATERRVFNIYSNNTIAYNIPAGGAPQFHRSTDTTYGIGSENYYGHNKVINNLTTASYVEGESLAAYQGKVLKDAIDGKQASITGGASSITSSNLTASRALVSNGSGKVAVSAVTATELGYLDGVTSNVQTQLNGKLKSSGYTGNDVSRVMITDSQGVVMPYSDGITVTQLYALRNIDDTQTVQNQIDGKAPTNHQSTATTYGVGTALAYGHVKVANNLSTASFDADAPVVLSAYQGKVLKDGITAVTPTLPSVATTGKSNQSVTSATDTNMGSFTLAKGLWLVVVTARWDANATGVRQVWLASSSTGSALNYSSVVSHQGANGAITSEQLTVFLNVTSQTTYYIVVRQSSGSALTCNTQYSTCRLGDA